MAKQSKGELVVVTPGFDYTPLGAEVADKVRETAETIRQKIKRTTEDIIAVGQALLVVKDALEHGQFGQWLKAEFGWTDRTARNFMAVAAAFGPKTEMISEMQIDPTAAYLLAAPSVPEEAREQALERAEAGERISPTVAKEIVSKARKKETKRARGKKIPVGRLTEKLVQTLGRYRERWNPKELAELARQLRLFADGLDAPLPDGKGKGK